MAPLRVARFVPAVAVLLAVAALAGCGSEGVRSYTVPRASEKSGGPVAPVAVGGDYRILGAIYPAESPLWYFKLTGSAADLTKHEADFDKFIASVKLAGDALPTFTLPDGWVPGGPKSISRGGVTVPFDQTIKIGALELTISKSQGGALANVNRWAEQVGAAEVEQGDLGRYTREFAAADGKGVRVDVKGPKNPAVRRPMMGGR